MAEPSAPNAGSEQNETRIVGVRMKRRELFRKLPVLFGAALVAKPTQAKTVAPKVDIATGGSVSTFPLSYRDVGWYKHQARDLHNFHVAVIRSGMINCADPNHTVQLNSTRYYHATKIVKDDGFDPDDKLSVIFNTASQEILDKIRADSEANRLGGWSLPKVIVGIGNPTYAYCDLSLDAKLRDLYVSVEVFTISTELFRPLQSPLSPFAVLQRRS